MTHENIDPKIIRVGAVLQQMLINEEVELGLRDAAGGVTPVRASTAGAEDGLLPVFLVAAEAVWREASGHGFGLEIRASESTLLGYRVTAIDDVPFSIVMLCLLEVVQRTRKGIFLAVEDLASVTEGALARASFAALPKQAA